MTYEKRLKFNYGGVSLMNLAFCGGFMNHQKLTIKITKNLTNFFVLA